MKTKINVQQTSLLAYYSLTDLTPRQNRVYRTIERLGTACNQQIADELDLPVNQVTGRTFELRDKGIVVEAYRERWEPTGKTVIFWKVKA